MQRHGRSDIERFVAAIDAAIEEPTAVLVIGGAAAIIHYGAESPTHDIDTFQRLSPALERAAAVATAQTGLDIPVSFAAVADAPYNFEDRLERVTELGLRNLDIYVPERHDLALMKTVRGYEHDVEVIAELHRKQPFDLDVLKTRLHDEMSHVIKDPRTLRLNFVQVVDRLFGTATARLVRDELDWQARRNKDRGAER
jgi:hypothetical protein